MKSLRFWFVNSRPVSLPQSMMPALVAITLAAKYSDFKWYLALLCFLGTGFAHLSLNLFDDLFDYLNAEQGDRTALAREGIRARTIKCPALQDGTVNPWQWLLASCIFGFIACCFGLPVLIIRGWSIVIVLLIVAVLGIFYSAKPLKLSYNGFGELIIGIIFGPLLGIGMCLGCSGEFHAGDVFIAVCWGLLVVNILYVHSVLDYEADMKAGKKTLAWLVHGENNKYIALAFITFVPFVLIALGAGLKLFSLWYLLGFAVLPWSIALFASMLKFKKEPFGKIEKRAWYGNFRNWELIKQAGLDWFMLRWYLAQKIDTIFCLLCIVAAMIGFAGLVN